MYPHFSEVLVTSAKNNGSTADGVEGSYKKVVIAEGNAGRGSFINNGRKDLANFY